jgi:hypothetical protein
MNRISFEKVPTFGQNWSRAKYDPAYIDVDTKQSTAPLTFALDPNYAERCQRCLPTEVGWIGKQGVSYDTTRPIVDTESDLFNITRILSKDPSYKYRPQCITDQCIGVMNDCNACQPKLYNFPICGIRNEYTRYSNPISTLKETGVNRFQPICLNPQDPTRWLPQGEIGINYRMVVKDNHVPCIPHPIDQSPALPKGGELPCVDIKSLCVPPIRALNVLQAQSEQLPLNFYRYPK